MPLTPEDVREKTFNSVRLREGYDTDEVDNFLDEVETELTRLGRDNDDLRAKVAALSEQAVSGDAPAGAPAESPAVVPTPLLPAVTTGAEASAAVTRLLEIATANAEQLVTEAQAQAIRLLDEAKASVESLESETLARVERMEADARTRSEKLDAETTERRQQVFGQLEEEKETLARSMQELRDLEADYRRHLRAYFEAQIKVLEGTHDVEARTVTLGSPDTRRRLRELLGDDA
jgi:DivIVA domain-containing protein